MLVTLWLFEGPRALGMANFVPSSAPLAEAPTVVAQVNNSINHVD